MKKIVVIFACWLIFVSGVTGLLVWTGVSIYHEIASRGLKDIFEQIWEGNDETIEKD